MAFCSRLTHLETANQAARDIDIPPAGGGLRVVDESIPKGHWAHDASINFPEANRLLKDNGANPALLGKMAVVLYSGVHRPQWLPSGSTSAGPGALHTGIVAEHNSRVHFPVISLNIDRSLDEVNFTLLHELRHITQAGSAPLYNRLRTLNSLRAASLITGLALLAGTGDMLASEEFEVIPYLATSLSSGLGIFTAAKLPTLCHYYSPREFQANRFAKQNADVKLITLSSE